MDEWMISDMDEPNQWCHGWMGKGVCGGGG